MLYEQKLGRQQVAWVERERRDPVYWVIGVSWLEDLKSVERVAGEYAVAFAAVLVEDVCW